MSARLTEIQRRLGAVRGRLAALGDRLAALRERMGRGASREEGRAARNEAPETVPRDPPATLFPGFGRTEGGLDDVELTFEVLDSDDPGRNR